MSKLFDASIMQWRERTEADNKWARDVVEAVHALEGKKTINPTKKGQDNEHD